MTGLVLGNEDPRTFTAGADLSMVLRLIQDGDSKKLEAAGSYRLGRTGIYH